MHPWGFDNISWQGTSCTDDTRHGHIVELPSFSQLASLSFFFSTTRWTITDNTCYCRQPPGRLLLLFLCVGCCSVLLLVRLVSNTLTHENSLCPLLVDPSKDHSFPSSYHPPTHTRSYPFNTQSGGLAKRKKEKKRKYCHQIKMRQKRKRKRERKKR